MTEKREKKRPSGRLLLSAALLVICVPLALFFGAKLGDRRYYLVGTAVLLLTLGAFFTGYERKRPDARELAVLAVLSALAVAGRAAFAFLPFFKPIAAIAILAGVAFGGEAGFLCGAVSALASNFIFGQGPWTPWQMFAFGIAGFLAGVLYRAGILRKKTLPLCVFGAAVVMLLVGPILDTCTLFTAAAAVNRESALAVYAAGLPTNAVHAAATAVFLLLLAKPLLEKLDRMRLKYGMGE